MEINPKRGTDEQKCQKRNEHTQRATFKFLKGSKLLENVRVCYIGSTGSTGLHHLVTELVDNSIDEIGAGYGTQIDVKLHRDGSVTVADDGRGIPIDMHATAWYLST